MAEGGAVLYKLYDSKFYENLSFRGLKVPLGKRGI